MYDPKRVFENFRNQNNQNLMDGCQQDAHEFWMRLMELIDCKRNCCMQFNKLFEHQIKTSVQCGNCSNISTTREVVSAHIVNIQHQSTVQGAMNAYFDPQGLESYTCSSCGSINIDGAKKTHFVEEPPKCFCLVLNRFQNTHTKIYHNLLLNPTLTLHKCDASNDKEFNYKLVSIVNHVGENLINGHYTATSCTELTNYEFDDSFVRRIDAVNGQYAYILIYELTVVCPYLNLYTLTFF